MFSGCSAVDGMISGETPEMIATKFAEGWKACGALLTAEGAFDQAAVSKAGWKPTSRILHLVTSIEQRAVPPDSAPVLRDDEYESTIWARQGQNATLNITRWGVADGRDLADRCDIVGKLNAAKSADLLADKLSQVLGRPVDRKGETSRGGDFLTPRFDANPRAWYWQMPQHDVYLLVNEGIGARLEILAMPNRVALYEYPLEEPTRRIFVEGQKL
jgi:hypothetical protein